MTSDTAKHLSPRTTTAVFPPATPLAKSVWPNHKVLGYYAFSQSAIMPPSSVPWSLLTHILLAFGTFDGSFNVTVPSKYYAVAGDLFSTAIENGVKPVLSIGGYGAGSQYFSEMVKTKDSRGTFISSLKGWVEQYSLSGIDLDWEYPGRSSSAGVPFSATEDVPNLLLLLQELRSSFPSNITISAALSSSYPWSTNLTDFANLLDWGSLMDYNFLGAKSSMTGSTSPLTGSGKYNIEFGAKNWTDSGMPWEKLVLGIPGYGRAWILSDVPPRILRSHCRYHIVCIHQVFPFACTCYSFIHFDTSFYSMKLI
jgi:chitinase